MNRNYLTYLLTYLRVGLTVVEQISRNSVTRGGKTMDFHVHCCCIPIFLVGIAYLVHELGV